MPKALITGVTGQDGSYLAEFLLDKGYDVVGMVRRTSTINFHRIAHIQDQIELVPGDLGDQISLIRILEEHRPDEVYNLAAQSFVQTSWNQPVFTGDVTGLGVTRHSGCHSHCRSAHPHVPGQLQRDVWQGCGSAPEAKPRRSIRAVRMAWPRFTATGLRSIIARATTCTPPRASCSTTSLRAAGWSSSRARSLTTLPESSLA